MTIEQTFTEVNNFYCNAENTIVSESIGTSGGYAMTSFKYGAVVVALVALGYGAFELVTALVAWLVVVVPALLAVLLEVFLKGLAIVGVLIAGYWAFVGMVLAIDKGVDRAIQTKNIDQNVDQEEPKLLPEPIKEDKEEVIVTEIISEF